MRIQKLVIRDMWSFAGELTLLKDFGQCTIIIGKNNSGKSNIRRALLWFKEQKGWLVGNPSAYTPKEGEPHDYGRQDSSAKPHLSLTCRISKDEVTQMLATGPFTALPPDWRARAGGVLSSGFTVSMDVAWDGKAAQQGRFTFVDKGSADQIFSETHSSNADIPNEFRQRLPGIRDTFQATICNALADGMLLLPGWRKLQDGTSHGGRLIEILHRWRSPPPEQKAWIQHFQEIEQLVTQLTGLHGSTLQPQGDGSALNISWRDRYLPINAFGDGVIHLLMMAVEFATRRDHVFIIEEPETHLHPELQRNLMQIIRNDQLNQYIVTTHSPVLLDAGNTASVFRVDYDGDASTVRKCETTSHIYSVLDALDVRASDILQANLVIWVEGPTDRMFLKKCFELRKDRFVEGIDYQIVYYGGSLRRHVTFEDPSEFVNLIKLSRHIVMICDSDRDSETEELDGSKKRLQAECTTMGGLYWVTAGREIENYIPDCVLTKCFSELLGLDIEVKLGQFEKLGNVLNSLVPDPARGDAWKTDYEHNKVRVMPKILEHLTDNDLEQFHLREKLEGLADRIKRANPGIPG